MRIPLDWLEDWVGVLPTVSTLAERLTVAGLEVEEVVESVVHEKVVLGRVESVEKHPKADRLRVCEVDLGAGTTSTIVCGAPNVAAGQFVPVATPGTLMPDGKKISAGKLRGVLSSGMICSESELGLGENHDGILVLADRDFQKGTPLEAGRQLSDFLPPVTVFDIAITPNRGDCLSVLGIARDVAALIGGQLNATNLAKASDGEEVGRVPVSIEALDLCPWYCAQRFSVEDPISLPLWMRRRLALAGIRSLSPIVDLTNYVMLEHGQPTHAFDLDKVEGGRLVVRRAGTDRKLKLLDGNEIELDPEDLVIADVAAPIALAGVMGGNATEVSSGTQNVVLESAIFDPRAIRRTARRLGSQTEASFRFEREVDPGGAATATRAFAAYGRDFGIRAQGPLSEDGRPAETRQPIALDPARVGQLLGWEISREECTSAFEALAMHVEGDGERLAITPPSYRNDVTGEADLIEEVARLRGYDEIPSTRPRIPTQASASGRGTLADLRSALRSRGFSEALTLSFADAVENQRFRGIWPDGFQGVVMRNPLATVASELRCSLLPGLLDAARLNRSRDASFVPLFTSGRVFGSLVSDSPHERRALAALVVGVPPVPIGEEARPIQFLAWKATVDSLLEESGISEVHWRSRDDLQVFHPGQTAGLYAGGEPIGIAGALHPRIATEFDLGEELAWALELDLEGWRAAQGDMARFRPLGRYPAVRRDLALVLDGVTPAGDLLDFLRGGDDSLVESVSLFDDYSGPGVPEGSKSLGFSVSYRAADRTLTDEEVTLAQEKLLARLATKYSFALR